MTVHHDLARSIALAQASKGNYLLFATESEDDRASRVFKEMAEDMDRHVQILESRLEYLEQYNLLNADRKVENGRHNKEEDDSE